MKTLLSLGLIAGVLALPLAHISAATFLPANSEVTSVRDAVEGDLYAANSSLVIAAPISGDIFAAGDSIDISGSSTQSVFAAGRTITISGNVGDDVRIAGNILSVSSSIAHDIFAAGSAITLSEKARVGGDLYVAGENLIISGTVAGDVRFTGSSLRITDTATITGDVTVYGNNDPVIEDGATITGNITTQRVTHEEGDESRSMISGVGKGALAQLALALALFFLAPVALKQTHEVFLARPFTSFIIGALWIILFLPITMLLLVSGIGSLLGLLLMIATAPLLIAAIAVAVISIGELAERVFSKKQQPLSWQHAVYGAVIMFAATFVGPLGFLLVAILVTTAFGSLLKATWNMVSGKK